jgi:nucleoside-diphosphate-sugar epimerase
MRVLLLGATGNLGQRLIFSLLAHKHTLTLYVRNPQKLADLVPSHILDKVTVVVGDATDSEGIYKALVENNCNAIVDTAGNQVLPWQEYLMPKIARAVMDAALRYKEEKGTPLRAWFLNGLGNLKYPGKEYDLQDHYL